MTFTKRFIQLFKALLPSPFTIAIVLSFFTLILALFFGEFAPHSPKILQVLTFWSEGLWQSNLLVFTVQMILMLLLGHVIALSTPVNTFISKTVIHLNSTPKAAFWVTLITLLVALFNWGLGLVFGAIFARKVAEHAQSQKIALNYPLIGAAGYSGLLIWHGGLSGSSLSKIAEPGHLKTLLPHTSIEAIDYSQTVFSQMNLIVTLMLLILLPLAMYQLGKRVSATPILLPEENSSLVVPTSRGAERLDTSIYFGKGIGLLWVGFALYQLIFIYKGLLFFTPNNINFLLFGLALLSHQNISSFTSAAGIAISGVTGIVIQFPLYFGIMGIISKTGLIPLFATFISTYTNESTLPFFTFFSAGIVNMFVPSGGGQWAIQGPILLQSCVELNANMAKNILAFAYGDQITNMLQPFWALPLLGITKLRAKDILPYSAFLLVVALPIFLVALWWF